MDSSHIQNENLKLSESIKAEALRLGFYACGISPAQEVDENHQKAFRNWIENNEHADMAYMANHYDKRMNPSLLTNQAKSVISVALNYYPQKKIEAPQYEFAWYAYGEDYHTVMKDKLTALMTFIKGISPQTEGRAFCDTAPLLERYHAWRGGLGWIGKHTQLIIPHAGSTFFLGELVIDRTLAYDTPKPNRCGNCTRCLEACPTGALHEPYRLDARRCLSYLTIENRGKIPTEATQRMGSCIYGCDRCQQACPWNRFATPCTEPRLQPKPEFLNMSPGDWQQLSVEHYRTLFKGSAVKRAKYEGLMRNITCVTRTIPHTEKDIKK